MRGVPRWLAILGCAAALFPAGRAAADALYLESIASGDLQTQSEIVSYTAGGVGFAGIRFTVTEPVSITQSAATLAMLPLRSSDLFFMGIELLAGPSADPTFRCTSSPNRRPACSSDSASSARR